MDFTLIFKPWRTEIWPALTLIEFRATVQKKKWHKRGRLASFQDIWGWFSVIFFYLPPTQLCPPSLGERQQSALSLSGEASFSLELHLSGLCGCQWGSITVSSALFKKKNFTTICVCNVCMCPGSCSGNRATWSAHDAWIYCVNLSTVCNWSITFGLITCPQSSGVSTCVFVYSLPS